MRKKSEVEGVKTGDITLVVFGTVLLVSVFAVISLESKKRKLNRR